jgi:UDP-4-amino-4,6-dideoxy-N-acetyl-beta-L-altrosamine N-acetyltransferase
MLSWRRVAAGDSARLLFWRNQPHVAVHQYTDHAISREEHDAWFARATVDPHRIYWLVLDDGEPIGLANLVDIDSGNSRCSCATYLGASDLRGKGIGAWIVFKMLDHAFLELKLNKMCCEVLANNPGVVRLQRRFGFREEGLLRQHVRKRDGFCDVHVLGLLRDDYLRQRDAHVTMLREHGVRTD